MSVDIHQFQYHRRAYRGQVVHRCERHLRQPRRVVVAELVALQLVAAVGHHAALWQQQVADLLRSRIRKPNEGAVKNGTDKTRTSL